MNISLCRVHCTTYLYLCQLKTPNSLQFFLSENLYFLLKFAKEIARKRSVLFRRGIQLLGGLSGGTAAGTDVIGGLVYDPFASTGVATVLVAPVFV